MNVYLAGGAVRDLIMGNPITDRDYLVMNTTRDAFKNRFPSAQEVGKAFPVFLLNKLEFSFPRATTIQDELRSRDLTVNAILLDEEGELHCHPKALEDIHTKTLRPASPESFRQDPIRVYRAARFWARFPDFTPHDELVSAMRKAFEEGLLKGVAPDRVGAETLKAMGETAPGNYLRLLAKSDCLLPWFEEFKDGLTIPAGPPQYHDSDVIEHTARIMDRLAGVPMGPWMGLCHDMGKMLTDIRYLPTHHGHDKRGMKLAQRLAKRIRLSNAHTTSGLIAAKYHMIAGRYDELRPGTRVDMLMDLHLSHTLEPLFALVKADQGTDHLKAAKQDRDTILGVTLPPNCMNLGAKSGRILRELRANALSKTSKL